MAELSPLDIGTWLTTSTTVGTIRGNYPVVHEWLKNLYWNVKGFKETTDFKHIKENVSNQCLFYRR